MSLSQSAIGTWFACPRKWKFTYLDGKESILPPSKEQRFGIGFHKLLEQYYLNQDTDWEPTGLEGAEKATAAALFAKYAQLYPHPGDTVTGAEVHWDLPWGHGIFDAVTTDGEWVTVVEHKTTKSDFTKDDQPPGVPTYWDKVKTDWQVGMYQLAAREVYGTSKVKVLYDVIRVPQLRQKKNESAAELRERIALAIDESPELYFAQAEVKWSDANLQSLREDLQDVTAQIAVAKGIARFPRSRKCYEWNRTCEFYPTCFQGVPLSDERLYQLRTRR